MEVKTIISKSMKFIIEQVAVFDQRWKLLYN